MMRHRHWYMAATVVVAVACGTDVDEPPRFVDVQAQSEDLAGRRVDIADRQARLAQIERQIDRIETQIQSPELTIDQHANWSRELFDLKHERLLLRSELNRAKIVSEKEWQTMQDTLEDALDSLEEEVSSLSEEVGAAVKGEGAGAPSTPMNVQEEKESRDG